MAIITLIFGGVVGEVQENRAGGDRLERKRGMKRARQKGPHGSFCLRMYVQNSYRVLPGSMGSRLKHLSVMFLLLRAALNRAAGLPMTHP